MHLWVTFEGRHFESSMDGTRRRVGFYASRRIEALSAEEIDAYAAAEKILAELVSHKTWPTPRSAVRVIRVRRSQKEDEEHAQGFSFFPEGSFVRRLLARFGKQASS